MSKIFVIGAVGAMCIEATRDLIDAGGNHEFMLADLNLEKLKSLQNELGNDNISIVKVDAGDFNEMRRAIEGYDFVMNGLAFGRAEPSIRACMEAKIPTILLDDFPQDDYYEGFQEAGVLCAAGVGMTPGVTDLMARWGVDVCDSVSEINVSWASFRPIAISPGLVLTTFWEMDPAEQGRAFFENGKMFPQPPLKESKLVQFEEPYGELPVYYVPHPETIRLSQFVPGIKKVVTMGTWPPIEMELLKQLIDFGVFDKKEIFHKGGKVNVLDIMGDLLHQLPRGTRTEIWGYALNVEIIGKRKNRDVKYVLKTSHPEFQQWGGERAYAKNVAIPMSIGTQLMLAGKTKVSSGYHTAYEIFEPVEFFEELAKRGILVHEEVYEHRQIVK
jgi:saccharopine dehydrogenase-like NADP-dependent oxidoreductase